jgi:hypothetical protein
MRRCSIAGPSSCLRSDDPATEPCKCGNDLARIEPNAPLCVCVRDDDPAGSVGDVGRRDRKRPRAIGVSLTDIATTRLKHRP